MVTLKDAFRQLIRDVRTEKLRTFLTVFGIVWGTVAISLMLAFGTGLHKNLIKQTAGLGDRIVIAWPGLTSIPFEGLGKGPFGGGAAAAVWRSLLVDEYAKTFAKAGGIGIADQVQRTLLAQQEVR